MLMAVVMFRDDGKVQRESHTLGRVHAKLSALGRDDQDRSKLPSWLYT